MRLSVRVRGLDEAVRTYGRIERGLRNRVMRRILIFLGLRVQELASSKYIVRGRGLGAPPLPDRLTFRTGVLSGSIAVDRQKLPRAVRIGTPIVYGPVHELGRRPFLSPALAEVGETADRDAHRILEDFLDSEF